MSAPVIIREWPKNVRQNLRVSLDEFQSRRVVDIRTWWWTEAGELRPGKSGLTVSTRHVRQLADGLAEAARRSMSAEAMKTNRRRQVPGQAPSMRLAGP